LIEVEKNGFRYAVRNDKGYLDRLAVGQLVMNVKRYLRNGCRWKKEKVTTAQQKERKSLKLI